MSHGRLRAIIFDFNGVIADDETTHFLAFQQALAEDGLALTKDEYYGAYLGMDERTCTAALVRSATGRHNFARVQRIAERKASLFKSLTVTHKPSLFPGVVEFVQRAATRYRLAIASGGRRQQIELALRGTPIEKSFMALVTAEDAPIGKPDPAMYLLTLARINEMAPAASPGDSADGLPRGGGFAGRHSISPRGRHESGRPGHHLPPRPANSRAPGASQLRRCFS